jgi:predicted acylesterase/phospholipase RssA
MRVVAGERSWIPWWEGMALHDGIFKGGGGKGILYVGALQEFAARNRWFQAVAGSSAGALTATLVAAGFHPDTLVELAHHGLAKLRIIPVGDLLGKPLVSTHQLRSWLDGELRGQLAQIGNPVASDEPLRFIHLQPTSIDLFVAALDVATRQPRVFGTRLTPQIELVDAVLASCAIPLAFRQGRLRVTESDGTQSVHRLIDGGVYANYPAFIFRDRSFRARHELEEVDDDKTIGFTIQHHLSEQPTPTAMETGWGLASRKDKGSSAGRFHPLLWALGRFYFFVLLPILVAFQMIDMARGKGLRTLRGFAEVLPSPLIDAIALVDGWMTAGLVGQTPLWLIVAALMLFVLLMAVVGYTLLDTGLFSARALMAVGTDVPYWVGYGKKDRVVRLAPPQGLGTFSFRVKAETVARYISSARAQAAAQLDELLPGHAEVAAAQESNLPSVGLRRRTGFEDQ